MSEYYADRVLIGVAENEAEVHAIFDDRNGRIQRVRCGYCERQAHTTRNAAVAWFLEHDCSPSVEVAIRAITTEHFGGTAEVHDSLTCTCVLGEAA